MSTKNHPLPEELTWRTFLGTLIKTQQQRQRVAEALDVHTLTLQRWVNNEATPHLHRLQRLLTLFPGQREHLLSLIVQEFPDFSSLVPELERTPPGIPSAFYAMRDIELDLMPPAPVQLPYLATFRQRVHQVMGEAVSKKQLLTPIQAEQLVWQDLEEELLQVALSKK